MLIAIEIALGKQITHPVPGLIIEQQTTQYRLFSFDGVRWHTQLGECRINILGLLRTLVHGA